MACVNGKRWKGDDETFEDAKRRTAKAFASRVLGWAPADVTLDGDALPFCYESVVRVLLDPDRGDAVFRQLQEFIEDERFFMKRSQIG